MSELIFGDAFETFTGTNKDQSGRVFGYVVGFRECFTTGTWHAWVQRSVRTKNGGFKDFGTVQRSKEFKCLETAKAWAYAEKAKRVKK